jgi:nitrate/nitrite-specific signal transduction histidine kinase
VSSKISQTITTTLANLEKAAASVEEETFDPNSLSKVTNRKDELGHLGRVFVRISKTTFERGKN